MATKRRLNFENRFSSFGDGRVGWGALKSPPPSQLCYGIDPSQARVNAIITLETEGDAIWRNFL